MFIFVIISLRIDTSCFTIIILMSVSQEQDSEMDAELTTNQIVHQQVENIIGSILR